MMNGGIMDIDEVMQVIRETFISAQLVDFPFRAAGEVILSQSLKLTNLYRKNSSLVTPSLDEFLQRLVPAMEDRKNLPALLRTFEKAVIQVDEAARLAAVGILTGMVQVAKNTLVLQLLKLVDISGGAVDEMHANLLLVGFSDSFADGVLSSTSKVARSILVDIFVTIIFCTLRMILRITQVTVEPDLAPITHRKVTAVVQDKTPVQGLVASPYASRADHDALKADVAAITSSMAEMLLILRQGSVAAVSAAPQLPTPPAPVPTKKASAPPPLPPLLSDSDSDDEDDLGLRVIASSRAALAAGVAAMRGKAKKSDAGEYSSYVPPVSYHNNLYSKYAGDTTHYLSGTIMDNTVSRNKDNYNLFTDCTADSIIGSIYSEEGLFLLSISGVPMRFRVRQLTKYVTIEGKVLAELYNPDGTEELCRLGFRGISVHLFPATITQFNAFIADQLVKCMQPSALSFEHTSREQLLTTVMDYNNKCQALFDGLFGGRSVEKVQQHARHVTLWALFVLFHVNRWMRAMLHLDISLLLQGFDSTWQIRYLVQVSSDAQGLPTTQLSSSLQLLAYKCPSCSRPGMSALWCSNEKCVPVSSTIHTSSTAAGSTAPTGYFRAYKAWKRTLPASAAARDRAPEAFHKSDAFKAAGLVVPSARAPSSSVASPARAAGPQVRANEQNAIVLHVCPDYQSA